jgi:hypothetical protein
MFYNDHSVNGVERGREGALKTTVIGQVTQGADKTTGESYEGKGKGLVSRYEARSFEAWATMWIVALVWGKRERNRFEEKDKIMR